MKTAYLFSGQGAQFAGMGQDLTAARPFYDRAATILGWQPLDLTAEDLQDTLYAQPATVCLSLAIWDRLVSAKAAESPYVLGGFSLGEYTAFAASGLLDVESTLRLVSTRARLMSEASHETAGKMYAILGLEDQQIETYLAENYADKVWPVNYNCPGQLVIAGLSDEVDQAALAFKAMGAKRTLPLQVSGAFHTPLMATAAKKLEAYAAGLSLHTPVQAAIYSNGSAQVMTAEELQAFPSYLNSHMTHSVKWTQTIQNMYDAGVRKFVEIGPGKTLRGLVSKILKGKEDVEISNLGTADELSSVLESL